VRKEDQMVTEYASFLCVAFPIFTGRPWAAPLPQVTNRSMWLPPSPTHGPSSPHSKAQFTVICLHVCPHMNMSRHISYIGSLCLDSLPSTMRVKSTQVSPPNSHASRAGAHYGGRSDGHGGGGGQQQ